MGLLLELLTIKFDIKAVQELSLYLVVEGPTFHLCLEFHIKRATIL